MRRTDDVHDPDFWRAQVRLIQYQVEEVLRFPLEKLRQVGSSLVPHYDEDQEGDQEDAAERPLRHARPDDAKPHVHRRGWGCALSGPGVTKRETGAGGCGGARKPGVSPPVRPTSMRSGRQSVPCTPPSRQTNRPHAPPALQTSASERRGVGLRGRPTALPLRRTGLYP